MNLREAAQHALEALEILRINSSLSLHQLDLITPPITALRAALEQPDRAQAMRDAGYTRRPTLREMAEPEQPYASPPRREWRLLSDDELTALGVIHSRYQEESLETGGWFDFARAVEAALKEKNL